MNKTEKIELLRGLANAIENDALVTYCGKTREAHKFTFDGSLVNFSLPPKELPPHEKWRPGEFPGCKPSDKIAVTASDGRIVITTASSCDWAGLSNIVSWKPAPREKLVRYVNIHKSGAEYAYKTIRDAKAYAGPEALRAAVKMVEADE